MNKDQPVETGSPESIPWPAETDRRLLLSPLAAEGAEQTKREEGRGGMADRLNRPAAVRVYDDKERRLAVCGWVVMT